MSWDWVPGAKGVGNLLGWNKPGGGSPRQMNTPVTGPRASVTRSRATNQFNAGARPPRPQGRPSNSWVAGQASRNQPTDNRVTMGQWGDAYNRYLDVARSETAGQWADSQARMADLLDEGNQRSIQADFSRLGGGIDQREADKLLNLMRQGNTNDAKSLDDADDMARRYNALMKRGFNFDSRHLSKQDKFLLRQLELDRTSTNRSRTEGRDIHTTNTRNIKGAATAAGVGRSSATDDLTGDEDRNLNRLLARAGDADRQSRKEYDQAMAALQREKQKVGDGLSKADLDLVNSLSQTRGDRVNLFLNAAAEQERARADRERRDLTDRQNSQQLGAFFEGIKRQQAEQFYGELTRQKQAQEQAFYAANLTQGTPRPVVNWFNPGSRRGKPAPRRRPAPQFNRAGFR